MARHDLKALRGGIAPVGAMLAVLLFDARYHEFWRDETQAALLARAVPLSELLPTMRREAVPPVSFLVLKAFGVLPPPFSLAAMGGLGFGMLLFGTYRLLLTLSGAPARSLAATAAFACTDTFFYELGVVVRPYGLGLGFALACIAYLGEASSLPSSEVPLSRASIRGSAFGALAASTAVHPGCVAGAALLWYSGARLLRERTLRSIAAPLCALPAFLFTFFLVGSYDRPPEGVVEFHRNFGDALAVAWSCFRDGVLCRGWWLPESSSAWAMARRIVLLLTGAACASVVLLQWRELFGAERRIRPADLQLYLGTLALSAATLSYIFVVRYQGAYRHHLFLFVPAVVMAVGIVLVGRRPPWIASAFAPWFLFQWVACGMDLAGDRRGALSDTKAAAAALPDRARVVVAGDDWMASGILYWRPDVSMRAQSSLGRPFRYLIEDWDWHRQVPLDPLLHDECTKADEVVIATRSEPPGEYSECLRRIFTGNGHLESERFSMFELPCSCLPPEPQPNAR